MLNVLSQTRVSGGNQTHYPHTNNLAHYTLDYHGTQVIQLLTDLNTFKLLSFRLVSLSLISICKQAIIKFLNENKIPVQYIMTGEKFRRGIYCTTILVEKMFQLSFEFESALLKHYVPQGKNIFGFLHT